jgi:acetolactate synthase-1/2/3 large subunit
MASPDAGVERDLSAAPAAETVAEAFLQTLRSRGIEYFFVNAGTDFAPLVEAYARFRESNDDIFPKVCVAGHENLAMGMAHGAYLMTQKPQAVMFHVNVGTANAICAAINAAAERVPLFICAGRSPLFEHGKLGARNTRVTWAQEMYDQGGMLRDIVKWEYELRGAHQLENIVERGLTIAAAEPKGPVYLTLPREILAEPLPKPIPFRPDLPPHLPTLPQPDPAAIALLADKLAAAELPVISSLSGGADPNSVAALAALCEDYAIAYADDQARYVNVPASHPMHLGHSLPPVLREADALCFVESDVPWVPDVAQPRADAFVAQCGIDPLYSRYPVRTHRADLLITTGATSLYSALAQALAARKSRIPKGRFERIAEKSRALREARKVATQTELAKDGPITNQFLSATLAKITHENCVLFNEYWAARDQFAFDAPSSYFYLPASGGLGWALPAALGAKLVSPKRTYIAAVGDGTYLFSNPAACHHASQKHNLPVLTVVCNNTRWNAVNATARLVYPNGKLAKYAVHPISDLSPAPAYEQYSIASGGFGERVSERGELELALRRAMHAVEQEGRQALLNVICA